MKTFKQVLATAALAGAAVASVPATAHAAEPSPPSLLAPVLYPGDVSAENLPRNTLGSANWANPNEVRPGRQGFIPRVLMGIV
jgi:hypothetical protein